MSDTSTPVRGRGAIGLLIALASAAVLIGCSAPAPAPTASEEAPAATGSYARTGVAVDGGGTLVTGVSWLCALEDGVIIDDIPTLTAAAPGDPVPSMSFVGGQVSYSGGQDPFLGTPTEGILEGTGSYAVAYDDAGWPTAITGEADVTVMHGGEKSIVHDVFAFTVTQHPLPEQCPAG